MNFPLEEPTAINRAAAREIRGLYVALVNEGFTDDQAIRIVGQMFAAATQTNNREE